MRDTKIISLIYSFFLGILLAMFIGIGINTFYSPPEGPKYPVELNTYGKDLTSEQVVLQKKFDTENQAWEEKMKPYNRNVSLVVLVAAVGLLALSLIFEHKLKIMSDGVMLGGLFSLLYSTGRGFASQDSKYVFMIVSVGLVTVLLLGYRKFVRQPTIKQD